MPKTVYSAAHASVRFFGESFDPLEATQRLRLPPDATHRAGEPRLSRSKAGRVLERPPYRSGLWSMSSRDHVRSAKLATHIEWLLAQLEPRAEAVASLLANNVSGDIFAYSAGATAVLPAIPRQLRRRALALGLEIAIDHYHFATGRTPIAVKDE